MLRLMIRITDSGAAANVMGAAAEVTWRTMDVSALEVEQFLAESNSGYTTAAVVGVEVLPAPTADEESAKPATGEGQ